MRCLFCKADKTLNHVQIWVFASIRNFEQVLDFFWKTIAGLSETFLLTTRLAWDFSAKNLLELIWHFLYKNFKPDFKHWILKVKKKSVKIFRKLPENAVFQKISRGLEKLVEIGSL